MGYYFETWTWGMENKAKSFKYRTTTYRARSFQPICQQFINSIDSFDVWFVLSIASFWGCPKIMITTVRIITITSRSNVTIYGNNLISEKWLILQRFIAKMKIPINSANDRICFINTGCFWWTTLFLLKSQIFSIDLAWILIAMSNDNCMKSMPGLYPA